MKAKIELVTLLLVSTAVFHPFTSQAQGDLNPPPGVPAPTMKTLSQIEPRTPISSAPFTISAPGSYYLTANLNVSAGDAITITADEVTLDLNGYTISSTTPAASGTGILLSGGRSNIAVSNGFIRGGVTVSGSGLFFGSGFASGIDYTSPIPVNVRISHVTVSGCMIYGIYLGASAARQGSLVESCTVNIAGSQGILGDTVSNSIATNCGSDAITANQASSCHGKSFAGNGIVARAVQNSFGETSTGFAGINATAAQNCWGSSSTSGSYGLLASEANNCHGTATGSTIGLSASTANNSFGITTGSGTGLFASRTANNCWGSSASGIGLSAVNAQNCYGVSTSGTGLTGTTMSNSSGVSTSGFGIIGQVVGSTATGCRGTSETGTGLSVSSALNCSGFSNSNSASGLGATVAQNCYGVSSGSNGIGLAASIAIGCYGQSLSTGTGLQASIANSSQGLSNGGSPINIGFKYNMPQ